MVGVRSLYSTSIKSKADKIFEGVSTKGKWTTMKKGRDGFFTIGEQLREPVNVNGILKKRYNK